MALNKKIHRVPKKNGLQQLGKYQPSNVVKDVHKGFAVKKQHNQREERIHWEREKDYIKNFNPYSIIYPPNSV